MCGRHWIAETTEAPFFLFARYFSNPPLTVFIILNIIILWKNREEEAHEVGILCGRVSGGGGWYNRKKNQDEMIQKKKKKKKKREPRQRVAQLSWSYETILLCLSFQAAPF